jgi:hypothetical protein
LAFYSGREADHSPPSSAEVKDWVELYLHSPNTPSWRGVQGEHRDNFFRRFGRSPRTGHGPRARHRTKQNKKKKTRTYTPGFLAFSGKIRVVRSLSLRNLFFRHRTKCSILTD